MSLYIYIYSNSNLIDFKKLNTNPKIEASMKWFHITLDYYDPKHHELAVVKIKILKNKKQKKS